MKLVSATEVISAGSEGIILESVLEGYAEYYSADLSEKVVRGMTENALKGIYNGGTIPFGYMIDETTLGYFIYLSLIMLITLIDEFPSVK